MAKYKSLDDIFADEEFIDLLDSVEKKVKRYLDPEIEQFKEINDFYRENYREPLQVEHLGKERRLYNRLKGIRASEERMQKLKPFDEFNLLKLNTEVEFMVSESTEEKSYSTLDDFFNDASDLFGDNIELQNSLLDTSRYENYKQTRKQPDYIARQKKVDNFENYEAIFNQVRRDITEGKRQVVRVKNSQQINTGDFFILKGIMLYVEKKGERFKTETGYKNARLSVVYENGKKSDILMNSLAAGLRRSDAYKVTDRKEDMLNNSNIENVAMGSIYVLKSKSQNPQIANIPNLYKIGVTTGDLNKRLSNAENESTYLYAPVTIVAEYEVYNFNARKLETTLHHILSRKQLDINIKAPNGKYIKPREWFIVSLDELDRIINEIMMQLNLLNLSRF